MFDLFALRYGLASAPSGLFERRHSRTGAGFDLVRGRYGLAAVLYDWFEAQYGRTKKLYSQTARRFAWSCQRFGRSPGVPKAAPDARSGTPFELESHPVEGKQARQVEQVNERSRKRVAPLPAASPSDIRARVLCA